MLKKFEYKVRRIEYLSDVEIILNNLGEEGWELISTDPFVFKREKLSIKKKV